MVLKRRRFFALTVAAVLLVALVAGCAKQPAPAQPSAPSQGTQPPPAPKKLKVGLVFDVGGRGDLSFNDSAYAGLERAQQEFGDKLEVKFLEPSQGGENREQLLRLLAEDKYDLVFGVGFLFTEHIARVSKDFPGTKFALIDGFIENLNDSSPIACLLFKEQEGSFLVGAAAGLKTKTNKVGFVGGMKIPLIEKFEAGYIAGVKYVNPKAEVPSDYIGTTGDAFKDPAKGKELALKHFSQGTDIEYHASGASGLGVIEAASAQHKLAIGVDSDQSLTVKPELRPAVLTSMLKRVDVAVYTTIKSLVNNQWKGGYRVYGLAEDGVGYAMNDYNKAAMSDIVPKLEELKKKVVSGEIAVPATKQELGEFLKKLPK